LRSLRSGVFDYCVTAISRISRPVIPPHVRRILQLQAGVLPDLLCQAEGSRPALP
jgi:hypothetical protein